MFGKWRKMRMMSVAVAFGLATLSSTLALPAFASGGPGGGGGAGGPGVRAFRMNAALFSGTSLSGVAQYRLDASGAQLLVNYTNVAGVPAGTTLGIFLDGRQVGTLTTTAQGASVKLNGAALLGVPLSARIELMQGATVVASGGFTLGI